MYRQNSIWFSRDLEKSDDTAIQSKADQLLGCRKVADIVLWRNEKNTSLWKHIYFVCRPTFVCAVALYGLSFVPSKIFGFLQVKKISPWRFEISESVVRDLSRDIVVAWNHGVHSLNSLSKGGDWIKFFKAMDVTSRTSYRLGCIKSVASSYYGCYI
ncbi:hypothetical protein YC2023_061871 [Brassica napus]